MTTTSSKGTSTKAFTPKATLSYPHLHAPQLPQDGKGKAKYSVSLVFAPGTDLSELKAAANAAIKAKFGATYTLPNGTAIPSEQLFTVGVLRSPFRTDALLKGYPDGSTFINVRTEQKPGVVYAHAGPDGKPAVMPQEKIRDEMYAGAQVRASVAAFYYDSNGNKGISFALNNLQKLGEGERLDGRVSAENEFEADLNAAPADLAALTG